MKSLLIGIMLLAAIPAAGQEFTFDAFVGTWHGTISSEQTFGYNDPITLVVQENGFYTDSTGRLMPSIYRDTQVASHLAATNRVEFRWVSSFYAGQTFYTSAIFEIVEYTGNYLELHYNFWDDPEPYPHVQKLVLTREGSTLADVPGAGVTGLEPNWPNPFNPSTTLAFTLAAEGPARLEIFDQRGRRVATLSEGVRTAGRHEVTWRAEGLPSGVYLSRLTTAVGTESRSLTLVK